MKHKVCLSRTIGMNTQRLRWLSGNILPFLSTGATGTSLPGDHHSNRQILLVAILGVLATLAFFK